MNRETHEANKREAFDGMRAYHQSEISHKQDAITILQTLLTSTILIYGGLIGAIIARELDPDFGLAAGVFLVLLIGAAVILVVAITNKKIDADNGRYRQFRSEYLAERHLLGLDDDLKGDASAWSKPTAAVGGYHHTKAILRVFGGLVVGASIVGAIAVAGVVNSADDTKQAPQAGAL
jgi:hypothetical protein